MNKNTNSYNCQKKAQSQQLQKKIASYIKHNGGAIPFSEFMQQALYTPKLGYYTSDIEKFGQSGDFITAPKISPLFAECIAKAISPTIDNIESCCIIEIGPGDGTMACQILKYLAKKNRLPKNYYCIEISKELSNKQQQNIKQQCPELAHLVKWESTIPKQKIKGVIIANEVIDAIPVDIFLWHKNKLLQRMVTLQPTNNNLSEFVWQNQPANEKITTATTAIKPLLQQCDSDIPYCSEVNTQLHNWIKNISDTLAEGMVLCIDYGYPQHIYYHPQRNNGTIMCYSEHKKHDNPLINPGIQDITTSVDFTALALAAHKNGLHVQGYTSQAQFLLNCGITNELEQTDDPVAQYSISQKINKLVSPDNMGEIFKVMALTKTENETLKQKFTETGFQSGDRRHELMGYAN